MVYCLVDKKIAITSKIFGVSKEFHVEAHTEINMMGDEAFSFTGSYYATISPHFFPPPVADLFLVTFTHSYPSCLLLSTVAETVSHFKECESGFQKTLPPFNLSNAPLVLNQTSLSFSLIPSQEVVVEEMSALSNYYKLIMFFYFIF